MPTVKLLCKVGAYAGRVLEYPVHVAEALLDSGQAERPPQDEPAPTVERAVQAAQETPEEPEAPEAKSDPIYVTGGWWEQDGIKVRGSKDADPADIAAKIAAKAEEG